MLNVAIIPARGGSKRIPKKNIKFFNGEPIIAWSIKAAKESKCFDRIIVSSDSEEILSIARKYGAETPFIRPKSISDDLTNTTQVINHSIEWLKNNNYDPDNICCIYPTAPFIQSKYIRIGLTLLEDKEINFSFPVTSYPYPIQRALKINNNKITMFYPKNKNIRSQDLEPSYHDAGQFYWGKASCWLKEKAVFSEFSAPIIIPRYLTQDIDTQEDWDTAELMFKSYDGLKLE